MKKRPSLLLLSSSLLLLVTNAQAQSQLLEFSSSTFQDHFGTSVDGGHDVNGDGLPDIVVGGWGSDALGSDVGEVWVQSGFDGSRLWTFNGDSSGDRLGNSVALTGDVDGDGRSDILAGAPGGGYARLYSGSTGQSLHTWTGAQNFSWTVFGAGDVDGDGVPDIGVGTWDDATNGSNSGALRIYSGANWSLLHEWFGQAGERYGEGSAAAGDVNSDGAGDLLVSGGGRVDVRSGSDGSVLWSFQSVTTGSSGSTLAGGADFDGDGVPDIAIGSPAYMSWSGRAQVRSGATGALLFEALGASGSSFGSAVAFLGDDDQDGRAELLIGAPTADPNTAGVVDFNAGQVSVHHGGDGALLAKLDGKWGADNLGTSLAATGDLDSDGRIDLVVGASGAGAVSSGGSAHVLSLASAASFATYCTSLPNSTGLAASISASGSGSVYFNDLMLRAQDLPPGVPVLFFYGAGVTQVPFGDGLRCVGGVLYRSVPALSAGASGVALHAVDLRLQPGPSGLGLVRGGETWHFQGWYRDVAAAASGFNLTDGVSVSFVQ